MDTYKDVRLLIVDDNQEACDTVYHMVSALGIKTDGITESKLVVDQLKDTFYNIVLLDIVMPEKSGFDLIPEIDKLSPDTKIIIMTGYADKEKAIEALRLGVFDFLEKPITMKMLSYAVKRALDTQKIEKALSVLAKNMERTRVESERRVVLKIKSLIIPVIEKLRRDKNLKKYKAELSVLVRHIEDLTSSLANANDVGIAASLSSSQLRIASMIMNGLTSQEIAKQLHISVSTVKTHRKNIRRKLNIKDSKLNLSAYLKFKMRKE